MQFTFSKKERLTGTDKIEALYVKGSAITEFPFKLIWLEQNEQNVPARVLFSVPKRKFKRAVDRNRIKRLMREAYRLNKSLLTNVLLQEDKKVSIFILYLGREIPVNKKVSEKIIVLLKRLSNELSQTNVYDEKH